MLYRRIYNTPTCGGRSGPGVRRGEAFSAAAMLFLSTKKLNSLRQQREAAKEW